MAITFCAEVESAAAGCEGLDCPAVLSFRPVGEQAYPMATSTANTISLEGTPSGSALVFTVFTNVSGFVTIDNGSDGFRVNSVKLISSLLQLCEL